MKTIQAAAADFEAVRRIVQTTIREVYPLYYPPGAVDFFCAHHDDDRIRTDIGAGRVYLLLSGGEALGTVTVCGEEISRLFVLPPHQGKGYGRALLDFAEQTVLADRDAVQVDASLPAKGLYLRRGYRETEYHTLRTENGDFLCYDVMRLTKASRA